MKLYPLALLLCVLFASNSFGQTMDIAYVRNGHDWRVIDKKGNYLTETLFEHDTLFVDCADEGMVLTEIGGKYGFYDLSTKHSIPNIYDSAEKFFLGLCDVKKDGKWFLIDREGKLGPFKNSESRNLSKDLKGLPGPDGSDILDHFESEVHVNPHQFIAPWNDVDAYLSDRILCYEILANKSCSCHKLTNYYGFISRKSEWVIPATYEWADIYSLGLAAVSQGAGDEMSIGYIDKDGKWQIQPIYQDCRRFRTIKIK